ncbi:MAG: polysaccharide biosynthesis/export family protein, partial [Metallibacterium scheffleri]
MTFRSAIPRTARRLPSLCAAALPLFALLLLGACAQPPLRPDAAPPASAILAQHTQTLPAAQVDAMLHPEGITYRLGPGDVIAIGVYLHPDLSIPPPGMSSTQGPPGAVVSNDGNLQLPLLGEVHVAGLTVGQLRSTLTTAYAHYIVNPSISIQVQQSRSIRYYLLG